MYPTIDLGWLYEGADISLYFLAIAIGFLGAAWLTGRQYRRLGIPRAEAQDFFIWMLIFGVLGSRLMHVFADGFLMDYVNLCVDPMLLQGKALQTLNPCISNTECLNAQVAGEDIGAICNATDGLCYPQQDCMRPLKFWAGGLTVYGALIACITFAYFYMRRKGWHFARMVDIAGPTIFFGIAVGRLGCLAAGCCYGALCDIDQIALEFPRGSLAYQHHYDEHLHLLQAHWQTGARSSLPVWPSQLISAMYNLAIFAVGYFVFRPRKRFHGQVILSCAILYGVCRFLIEFVRADFRGGALGLSTSQLVSIPVLLGSAVLFFVLWKRATATHTTS